MFKVDMSLDAFPVSAGMRELEKKHIPFVMARTATLLAQRVKNGTSRSSSKAENSTTRPISKGGTWNR